MASNSTQLHFIFFPLPAHGHLIPTVDMARLFARHGVKVTLVTTPLNALLFANITQSDKELGFDITTWVIKFPVAEAGLPEGCENVSSITSQDMTLKFLKAVNLFQQPLEQLLHELRPDCLVADFMFPWATDIAAKFKIPRLVFHGTSCFALCVADSLKRHQPFRTIASDSVPFDLPGLPHQMKMTRLQLPDYIKETAETDRQSLMDEAIESELRSYGVIVNSFHSLEPAYSEYYSKVMGRKAWHVGPVSLCNNMEDKSQRGNLPSIDKHECLRWLDSKKPNSVLYICFGSVFRTSAAQLNEIAKGVEASGQDFIWVVNKVKINEDKEEEWVAEGFEEKMEGKGLIIKGWAPQVMILDHEAVGGFMTHCGWNSTIESITAGVPMATWPLCAEQFYNEKLVTDVLKIGVGVGAKEWSRWIDERSRKLMVSKGDIERAVGRVMIGEEAEEMRGRAKELKTLARKAVEEGGSSDSDLNALLDEFRLKLK